MSHVDPSRALFEMLMARIAVIRDELSAIRYDSRELLRSEVVSILVHLNRAYTSQHGAARRAAPVLLAERFRHLVARHWRERWSISRYADALNVSAEHLGREIQHALGRTPADVAREPFIRELERVFLYSDDTMSDVAYRFGFPDPSSLSRYVKRHTGRTPSQIRKRT